MDKMVMLAGTIGQGVMRSADNGESWQRIGIYQGMHSDAMVRTLAHHPQRPGGGLRRHRQGLVPQRQRG